jgi:hypothetical protein
MISKAELSLDTFHAHPQEPDIEARIFNRNQLRHEARVERRKALVKSGKNAAASLITAAGTVLFETGVIPVAGTTQNKIIAGVAAGAGVLYFAGKSAIHFIESRQFKRTELAQQREIVDLRQMRSGSIGSNTPRTA